MRFVEPVKAVTHFHLREGDTVGDFGAGSGYFIQTLSRAVGREGKVFAFEIQKPLVEAIANLARIEHLDNVDVIWCDIEAQDGCKINVPLDSGIMVNTLFQIEKKETALQEVARLLRKGGKFFVIDWTESFAGMGPPPEHIVSKSDAQALVAQYGFTFERDFPAGEHHYGLAFRRQ